MSWILPTFDSGDIPAPPPMKKPKTVKPLESKVSLEEFTPSPSAASNWLLKYRPKNVDELAVHVKKAKELEDWLEQSTSVRLRSKFLLLTGPSGCGKTTALQTVCRRLGFNIFEWITPLDKPADTSDFPFHSEFSRSATKEFQDYLFRSSRYNSCLSSVATKKLVLVKDFPNVFLHNPNSFHEILENFSDKCVNPVVFVCSDEPIVRKLFTATVKMNCQIQTITFNPIPDQRMFKILKGIISQEVKVNKNIKALPDDALHVICSACEGDIRSAISKLYFCTINSKFDFSQLKSPVKGKFKKPQLPDATVQTDKDKKIDFFHGIGRVLYPKKIDSDKGLKFVHSSQDIVDNFLSEPNSFISQLHENYPTKFGNVHELSNAADRLAKSDILMTRWQDKDVFHVYSLSVAVQGLMVCNRNPHKAKFEAFRKSQTSRTEIDTKAFELEGKSLFSDLCILDYQSLLDILPFSRSLMSLNQGQIEYVWKTCRFK